MRVTIKAFLFVTALSLTFLSVYYVWSIVDENKCSIPSLHILCSSVKSSVHLSKNEEEFKNNINTELTLARKHILKAKRYARSGITNIELSEADDVLKALAESLNLLLTALEENETHSNVIDSSSPVCPEEYKGPYGGDKTFYRTGWDLVKCTDKKPLNSIVTILLNLQDVQNPHNQVVIILQDLAKFYPTLKVCIAVEKTLSEEILSVIKGLDLSVEISVVGNQSAGKVWNKLIKDVTTPYVFIGRDVERFYSDLQLERLIRVAHGLGVEAVGGAIRLTKDGYWSIGCRQFKMKNYTLAYIEGYDLSRNECLYCEHLTGPFVSRPELLKAIPLDETLPANVIFEDFFIQMKRANKLSMSCPDVMNLVRETDSKKKIKSTWLPLIRKWVLNHVHLHSKELHTFSCDEAGIDCKASADPSAYKGLAVPICCLEQLGRAVAEVFKYCDSKGMTCLSDSGGVVGSVKLGNILPWEIDADFRYKIANHSILKNSVLYFKQFGYRVVEGDYNVRPYFDIFVPGWRLEVYGDDVLGSEFFLKHGFNLTRINTFGYGHQCPFNPGYYVRSRYGHEVFWHVQHWRLYKEKHSFVEYKPGRFFPCPKPGHHACLDQYAVDGNLQFMGPWL